MVCVAIESPLQDDVRNLVAALDEETRSTAPPEYQFNMTAEEMADDDMTVFVARREDGSPVGIGALMHHDGNLGEVKRMYTLPDLRGERIGAEILSAIITEARSKKISRLALETGTAEAFEGAWRLYERAGFTRCGVVFDYPDSTYSRFYEKNLSA